MILQPGDRVRPWHRKPYFSCGSEWDEHGQGVPGGFIVLEVSPVTDDETGLYYVRAGLPAPYNQPCHDHHFRVRDTGEPWRMRNRGTALVLIARNTAPPSDLQMELFAGGYA